MNGPFQRSLLPGRATTDNINLAQEIIANLRRKKGKMGYAILKIDLEQAYDKIRWDFLEQTLIDFRFPRSIIPLLLFSIKSANYSVLWNGEETNFFSP